MGDVDAIPDAEVAAYVVSPTRDLNKVDDHELAVAKAKMEQGFAQHRILPTDPAFVYDKRVDFASAPREGEAAGSDWGSESDE